MGNSWSRSSSAGQRASQGNRQTSSVRRVQAVTEFKYGGAFGRGKGGLRPRPVGSCPVKEEDVTFIMVRAVLEWFVRSMRYIYGVLWL